VGSDYWLFDVGEGTQVQLQKCHVRPGKIARIFVTHVHGDHTFGLPGLLILIGRSREPSAPPLEIYGPPGLRAFVERALAFSATRLQPRYVVHELLGMPDRDGGRVIPAPSLSGWAEAEEDDGENSWTHGHVKWKGATYGFIACPSLQLSRDPMFAAGHSLPQTEYDAIEVGTPVKFKLKSTDRGLFAAKVAKMGADSRGVKVEAPERTARFAKAATDVAPGANGTWTLVPPSENVPGVTAVALEHTVPCVGFVVAQPDQPGRLRADIARPFIESNAEAIKVAFGLRDPRKLMQRIKDLQPDEELALPDGQTLRGSDVVGPVRQGRKIVVLGDNCGTLGPGLLAAGQDPDLLVLEATNTYLPELGDTGGFAAHRRQTVRNGHSTPEMAGALAKALGARAVLLTHFSQRYVPWSGVMRKISDRAAEAADMPGESVAAAYDLLTMPIWARDRDKPPLPPEARDGPPKEKEVPGELWQRTMADALDAPE
jgi:ribonuclease Z